METGSTSRVKAFLSLIFVASAFAPVNANAIFFFFPIPTFSAKGDTCVGAHAKEGDTFRSINGNVATIKTLSGTSSRCRLPEMPIVATVEYVMSSSFTSKAGLNLPTGYSPQGLSDLQKFNGIVLFAKHGSKDSALIVSTYKRDVVSDIKTFVARSREDQATRLDDPKQTEIEPLTINGISAWQYETKGKLKTAFGQRYSYLTTILDGESEVVKVTAWTYTANYESTGKEELKEIALSVTGINPAPPTTEPASTSAATPSSTASPFDAAVISAPGAVPPSKITPTAAAPSAAAGVAATTDKSPGTSASPADRLRELTKLHNESLVTDEEFEAKKKDILKSM